MSENVSNPTAWISLVNSAILPESPCIKVVDIVTLTNIEDNEDHFLAPDRVVPTSDTLYFLFQPLGKTFIQIWDVHSCQLVCTIHPQHQCYPHQCHMTQDGSTLSVVHASGTTISVDLWDIHSSAFIRKLDVPEHGHLRDLAPAISPDDRKLALAAHDGVRIYDLHTGIVLSSPGRETAPREIVYVVGWSPNSDWLLTCTDSGSAIVWQVTDNALEPITDTIQLNCWYNTFSTPNIIFSGDKIIYGDKKQITIGHLENGHFQTRVQKHLSVRPFRPLAVSPDGQIFVCTTLDDECVIVDTISGNIIGGPLDESGEKYISSLRFASGGKQLIGLCPYTNIRVWDVEAAIAQYRPVNLQAEPITSSASNEDRGPSTSTPTAPRNALRSRSGSLDSSILNLPISDVATPSATLLTPTTTQTPYTRRREDRKPIEYDSLLDLPATDAPIRPSAQGSPPNALRSSQESRGSKNEGEPAVAASSAPAHSRGRARLTALWSRIRRRRKPGPTPERESRAHKNKSNSGSIPMRDLSDAPVLPSAPAPTNHSEIVEVAAGRLDDRLVIAPPRKKKKKPPAAPPPPPVENEEVQPTSQSNASSSPSSGSSSSLTDSDAESIDWLDYICFCMCCPSNRTKKKKRKEKGKRVVDDSGQS
ncbi:WD40-repeat-containing domain protein [Hygrophoropsis aurantiaca]|uniref:WD40-repeat-containing domain protein n=1 Tax=Hygrophoropsis aurantiaca TaxID=72124 RepID=A0ACB8ADV6_9AGAM|nr:WD40-repeat-containing domain protein [Hygrophoropsis aurantiaca]